MVNSVVGCGVLLSSWLDAAAIASLPTTQIILPIYNNWSIWIVSVITALGVRWTGLPHSPKTDSDHLMKELTNCHFKGLRTVTARICLSLDDHYWSLDCRGVPSIGLPMLWLRSQSIMINNCTQQSSNISSTITQEQSNKRERERGGCWWVS